MSMMHQFVLTMFGLVMLNLLSVGKCCPRACRCDRRKAVYCNERELILIPYGIPKETQTLHLQLNNVSNGWITDDILSGLTQLKKLDMHQNKLTSVPKWLPRSLEYADFRINRIKYVGKTSLRGMTSLVELHLGDNNISNLGFSPIAFHDTKKLEVLVLSNNLLTEFPENLPASLRVVRLENNLIQVVSRRSMAKLNNLINLDLSQNAIAQSKIAAGAMNSLSSLRTLDLSSNLLTEIPKELPQSLKELMLSENQIEFIYKDADEKHGSLQQLQTLTSVDLSSNHLKSIQKSSFSSLHLRSIELHNNPWQCDCHLHYLKQWVLTTESTLSSESNIRCKSPAAFSGVTLNSMDDEALSCKSRIHARDMIEVSEVTSSEIRLQWHGTLESLEPPFIKRFLMYGPLKCKNCSFQDQVSTKQLLKGEATSFMESYSSQDVTSTVQKNPTNASIVVNGLQPETNYAVCIFDSQQDDDTISTDQCIQIWSGADEIAQKDAVFLPLWLIVLCCVLIFLVFISIVTVVIWKKKSISKSKTPQRYSNNRDDLYFSEAYLSGLSRPVPCRPTLRQNQVYGTNLTDRTYATCGPASITQQTLQNPTVDARREFDALIKQDGRTTPKGLHTPTSCCSECQENDTLSTTQTGRSSKLAPSGSPPPTYDSLHSYSPDQRSNLENVTPNPPRVVHEHGSMV